MLMKISSAILTPAKSRNLLQECLSKVIAETKEEQEVNGIKEKVRKLLELAGSSNENEARAALLKARRLMAEHKLSEAECLKAAPKMEIIRFETEDVITTSYPDPELPLPP